MLGSSRGQRIARRFAKPLAAAPCRPPYCAAPPAEPRSAGVSAHVLPFPDLPSSLTLPILAPLGPPRCRDPCLRGPNHSARGGAPRPSPCGGGRAPARGGAGCRGGRLPAAGGGAGGGMCGAAVAVSARPESAGSRGGCSSPGPEGPRREAVELCKAARGDGERVVAGGAERGLQPAQLLAAALGLGLLCGEFVSIAFPALRVSDG